MVNFLENSTGSGKKMSIVSGTAMGSCHARMTSYNAGPTCNDISRQLLLLLLMMMMMMMAVKGGCGSEV